MNLQFGMARKYYRRNAHPRLLISPDEVARLKTQIRGGNGKKIWSALRRKTDGIFNELAATADWKTMLAGNGLWNSLSAQLLFFSQELAFATLLTGSKEHMEMMRRLLRSLCKPDASKSRTTLRLVDFAMAYDLLHASWTPEERQMFARAGAIAIEERLAANRSTYFKHAGGNLPLMDLLAALPCALVLRGEPGIGESLEGSLQELLLGYEASVHVTANEKGYPEEDGGYGNLIMGRLVAYGEMLHRAGLFDVYKASPAFANSGRALLHFVQPWGRHLSNTGDHGDEFGCRELALSRMAARRQDPSLLWLYRTLCYTREEIRLDTGGQVPVTFHALLTLDTLENGRHPEKAKIPTAFFDSRRGIVSFRSGWGADDTFVLFDGSQRSSSAQGHAHASCGHFSLSAAGEYFSIDTGRYNIDQANHSVVLVNGKAGRPQNPGWEATKYPGRLIACHPGKFVDYAAGDSSHQHNIYWAKRHLGLVKGTHPYVWIVDDLNACDDWAEYTWQMQVCPENSIEIQGQSATVRGWRQGNLLDVHFALPAPEEYPKPHTLVVGQDEVGTGSWQYLKVPEEMTARVAALKAGRVKEFSRPSDMVHGPVHVRPRLTGKVAGYNGRFMTILIPRTRGQKPARVERLKSMANVLAVKITFPDGTEDRVLFAFDHRLLIADGVDKRGDWTVIRTEKNGRKTEQLA